MRRSDVGRCESKRCPSPSPHAMKALCILVSFAFGTALNATLFRICCLFLVTRYG